MVLAVNEGKRIGVNIGVFSCPGWSQSGGLWVKPEMAMRYITYSETKVKGGRETNIKLVKPTNEFQDVCVLAFPSIQSEERMLSIQNAKIKVFPVIKNENNLFDRDTLTVSNFSKAVQKYQVELTSNESISARSIKIIPAKNSIEIECEVFARIGDTYKSIKSFSIARNKLTPDVGPDKYAPIFIALPETKSSSFKLEFKIPTNLYKLVTDPNAKIESWGISEIMISEASGLEDYAYKNLGKMHPTPFPAWDSYLWKPQDEINDNTLKVAVANVIDISDKMDSNGNLMWDIPKGELSLNLRVANVSYWMQITNRHLGQLLKPTMQL